MARSLVLHKSGADPNYETWRRKVLGPDFAELAGGIQEFAHRRPAGEVRDAALTDVLKARTSGLFGGATFLNGLPRQHGDFALIVSERNTPALYGTGRMDAVTDAVLEAVASAPHPDFPEVRGRVSRLSDGRIGRFGWKAQTATLDDFVRTACAVELGLDVPGHPQGGLPLAPRYQAPGLDLDEGQARSLTAFVASLPPPAQRAPTDPQEARFIAAGKTLFARIGCAACHLPTLGDVEGIHSDLLLHDMGPDLSDKGVYGVFIPESSDPAGRPEPMADAKGAPKRDQSPSSAEWRTPPLWGFRDSAPYLHDGRAGTLERAIALHGGEGETSARRFFKLTAKERRQVETFLKSLVAPDQDARARERVAAE
jgi:CxxC motif-containing protein (DUF1111 family)